MPLWHLKHPEAGVADEEVENIEEVRKFLERWHWSCPDRLEKIYLGTDMEK